MKLLSIALGGFASSDVTKNPELDLVNAKHKVTTCGICQLSTLVDLSSSLEFIQTPKREFRAGRIEATRSKMSNSAKSLYEVDPNLGNALSTNFE